MRARTLETALAIWLFMLGGECACSPPTPMVLPVTNVSLGNGLVRRGVALGIGSPPQYLSFSIQGWWNDTWAYNTTQLNTYNGTDFTNNTGCDYTAHLEACTTLRGGLYTQPQSSSTHKVFDDVDAAGADDSDTLRRLASSMWYSAWLQDTLVINQTISLPSYPIGMPGLEWSRASAQNLLGLGRNSTFLTRLKNYGHIGSRSYGFWWGQTGWSSNLQMDGQLVLGGYDAAKTTGPNYTFPLGAWTANCPSGIYLNVSDLSVVLNNGTKNSLTKTATLQGCYRPDLPTMISINNDPYYDRWQQYTGLTRSGSSGGVDYNSILYDSGDTFTGSLNVSLVGGPTIEIPNDLLVGPQVVIDQDTGAITTNSSYSEVLINPKLNSPQPFYFGMQFFSLMYVVVDYDAGTFTIWQANPTTASDLVASRSACKDSDGSSSGSSGGGGRKSSLHKEGLSAGSIAGIIVGIVAVFAVVAALVWLYLRRRNNSRYNTAPSQASGEDYALVDRKVALSEPHEMGVGMVRCEADGGVAAHEMGSEPRAHEMGSDAKTQGLGSRQEAAELE
ncbi:hypothetical protein LTR78_005717 [Recurvomyces mirabilis]|uniref:Peptidase A1 domain-containing protein n=1 Tax=Recurvomyces mirabilis TaxID=574656 RepID=A0AAE0WM59_9PEZI|nr:hypothetical protein LTR78_005717 [Recurvomyces mirabilis]KAK5154097.1 hypothetical protein LTS14_006782 [Recurvomyces mirabilis]